MSIALMIVLPVVGAVLFTSGFFLGFITKRKVLGRIAPAKEARCPCQHLRNMHQGGTGKCGVIVSERYDTKDYTCACLFYSGPVILSEVEMQEMMKPSKLPTA